MIVYFAGQIGVYDLERIESLLFDEGQDVEWGILLTFFDLIDIDTGKRKKRMRKRERELVEFKRGKNKER